VGLGGQGYRRWLGCNSHSRLGLRGFLSFGESFFCFGEGAFEFGHGGNVVWAEGIFGGVLPAWGGVEWVFGIGAAFVDGEGIIAVADLGLGMRMAIIHRILLSSRVRLAAMLGSNGDARVVRGDGAGMIAVLPRVGDGAVDHFAVAAADDDEDIGVACGENGLEATPFEKGRLDVFASGLIGVGVVEGDAGLGIDENEDGMGAHDVGGEDGFGLVFGVKSWADVGDKRCNRDEREDDSLHSLPLSCVPGNDSRNASDWAGKDCRIWMAAGTRIGNGMTAGADKSILEPVGKSENSRAPLSSPGRKMRSFFLTGEAGRLEALVKDGRDDAPFCALVCHPHPKGGGTMHNKVVYHAAKVFEGLGWPVLRFNFRGAGLSEGSHGGRAEFADVNTALDWLKAEYAMPIVAAGVSFGAAMGLKAASERDEVTAFAALGLPIANGERRYEHPYLTECRFPKLFLSGDHDEYAPLEALRAVVETAPEPKRFVTVAGADHFFTGHLAEMQVQLRGWLEEGSGPSKGGFPVGMTVRAKEQ